MRDGLDVYAPRGLAEPTRQDGTRRLVQTHEGLDGDKGKAKRKDDENHREGLDLLL